MRKVQIPGNLNAATAQRLYALEILRRCDGDRTRAAKALEVDPQTLRRWMRSLEKVGVTIPAVHPGRPKVPRGRSATEVRLTPVIALATSA